MSLKFFFVTELKPFLKVLNHVLSVLGMLTWVKADWFVFFFIYFMKNFLSCFSFRHEFNRCIMFPWMVLFWIFYLGFLRARFDFLWLFCPYFSFYRWVLYLWFLFLSVHSIKKLSYVSFSSKFFIKVFVISITFHLNYIEFNSFSTCIFTAQCS